MKGDEVPLIPMNLKTLLMEGAHGCHPLDPLPPDPMDLLGKPCRCTPRCQPASQPWSQVKVSASPM